MFAQLGEIVFKGLNGFSSLSFSGSEANYAELELVNSKSILQHTGSGLTEISIGIGFDVGFCNPTTALSALQKYRDETSVLPFLFGNGRFIGHYVITSCTYEVVEAFDDGTFKTLNVSLSLKEYYSIDPLEQKKLTANAKAFAVNTTPNINVPQIRPVEVTNLVAEDITATKSATEAVNKDVLALNSNSSLVARDNIRNNAAKARVSLNTMISRIERNVDDFKNDPSLASAAGLLLESVSQMFGAYPFTDISQTNMINRQIQENTRSLSVASTPMMQKLILRK